MASSNKNPAPNLGLISLSSSEHCDIEYFVDQYILTREIERTKKIRRDLLAALMHYPPTARVSMFELNAWLDNRLGLRASQALCLHSIDDQTDQML